MGMRARATVLGATLALALAAAPRVGAKDLAGRFGVGVVQSLGGVSGLAFRLWPSERLGLEAIAGVQIIVPRSSSQSKLATTVRGSVGVVYNVARSLHANLGLGGRVSVGYRSESAAQLLDPEATSAITQVNLELPSVVLEFFLSDSFSVSVATGILIDLVPSSGRTLDVPGQEGFDAPSTTIVDIGVGALTGSLGIVYYF